MFPEGAGGLGVISTFFLPNTLEDFLAIAVGGAVGYAALLNLPLKRNDAKEKLTRVATNFAEAKFYLPPPPHLFTPSPPNPTNTSLLQIETSTFQVCNTLEGQQTLQRQTCSPKVRNFYHQSPILVLAVHHKFKLGFRL